MTIQEPAYPLDRYGLLRRSDALQAGFSDAMLGSQVRHGRLIRLASGVLVPSWPEMRTPEGADELYRLRSIASVTQRRSTGTAVLSHQSAAAIHGLRLLKPDHALVHATNGRDRNGVIRSGRHLHTGELPDDELAVIDGITVTGLARTAVDVAVTTGFAQALTAFDAALALGVEYEDLARLLADRRTAGARVARKALAYADGLSESVGESWSRAQMIEDGLVLPTLQRVYWIDGQKFRVDCDWKGKLAGEFDGLKKYGRLRRKGETVEQAVIREKHREDLLRATGLMLVRWIWYELERRLVSARIRFWHDKLGIA
ncbi:hypothetical protein [Gordonia sp. VNK21]|uniref:hypothetical protein n=1 Tax=Gordonia sp. VNK21 TaxID=3382483 RepID=UPI0038D446A1